MIIGHLKWELIEWLMDEYVSCIVKCVLWSVVSDDNDTDTVRIFVWSARCECDSHGIVFDSPSDLSSVFRCVIQIDQDVSDWIRIENEERRVNCLLVQDSSD